MKSAKITINPPEIKSVTYGNTFRQKPGQPMKLTIPGNHDPGVRQHLRR